MPERILDGNSKRVDGSGGESRQEGSTGDYEPGEPPSSPAMLPAVGEHQDRQGLANPPSDLKEEPDRLIIESTEEVKGGTLLIARWPSAGNSVRRGDESAMSDWRNC
jgi:hypothetical protein